VKKIGITGGIGSGKTTISRLFELLGVPVFYADSEARTIVNTDPQAIREIKALFGASIYVNGAMDRTAVAEIVFSDAAKLQALNKIVHPAVGRRFKAWVTENAAAPYVLKEAAILFESGSYKALDAVITVSAPQAQRMDRVMKRDGVAAADVEARMNNQMSDAERIEKSTFVLYNSNHDLVIPQILKIHHQIIE